MEIANNQRPPAQDLRDLLINSVANEDDLDDAVQAAVDAITISGAADGAYICAEDFESDIRSAKTSGILRMLLEDDVWSHFAPQSAFCANVWADHAWEPLTESVLRRLGANAKELVRAAAVMRASDDLQRRRVTLGLVFRNLPLWADKTSDFLNTLGWQAYAALSPLVKLAALQQRLRLELAARQRLHTIGLAYALESNVDAIARQVLTSALQETGMAHGTVRMFDSARDVWIRAAPGTDIGPDPLVEISPKEIETTTVLARCLNSVQPVVIQDVGSDSAWQADLAQLSPGPRKYFMEGITTCIAVPMRLTDRLLGVIFLQSERRISFSASTFDHIELLAQYA